jgi:RNA polymerase sigma-70 factor, ECF subfamily
MKDDITLEDLYERFSPMVYRRCYAVLKDEDEAADCMQETFIKIHSNWESLRLEHPSSLLYTIATNCALNRIRSKKRKREDELLETIAQACTVLEDISNRSLIAKILKRSDEKTGAMAIMHYSDGWSVAEVADHFGVSISAVRKRLAKLQECASREFIYE